LSRVDQRLQIDADHGALLPKLAGGSHGTPGRIGVTPGTCRPSGLTRNRTTAGPWRALPEPSSPGQPQIGARQLHGGYLLVPDPKLECEIERVSIVGADDFLHLRAPSPPGRKSRNSPSPKGPIRTRNVDVRSRTLSPQGGVGPQSRVREPQAVPRPQGNVDELLATRLPPRHRCLRGSRAGCPRDPRPSAVAGSGGRVGEERRGGTRRGALAAGPPSPASWRSRPEILSLPPGAKRAPQAIFFPGPVQEGDRAVVEEVQDLEGEVLLGSFSKRSSV